jgi:hypothetical protein
MRIDVSSEAIPPYDDLITMSAGLDIAQGDWLIDSGTLSTVAVASCIALAAHNGVTSQGLLGHFSTISPEAQLNPRLVGEQSDSEAFTDALAHLPDLGPARETQIWLGGASLDIENSAPTNYSILYDRRYGKQKVTEAATLHGLPTSAICIDWCAPDLELYIRLDCAIGHLLIRPIEDNF